MPLIQYAERVGLGIIEIPASLAGDVFFGSRRMLEDSGLFGKEVKLKNQQADFDFVYIMLDIYEGRRDFFEIVDEVLTFAFENLSDEAILAIASELSGKTFELAEIVAAKAAVRRVKKELKKSVGRAVARRILQSFMKKYGARLAVISGTLSSGIAAAVGLAFSSLTVNALLERATNATDRLKKTNPILLQILNKKGLSPLYFLVEEHLEPLVLLGGQKNLSPQQRKALVATFNELFK